MRKRLICALLSACVLASSTTLCSCGGGGKKSSSFVGAEPLIETVKETEPEYKDKNGVGYNISDDGTLTVVKADKGVTELVIPSEVKGKKVTSVSQSAFKNSAVTSVKISKGVKRIDDFAFALNSNLKEVELPEGLESIGNNAFFACYKLKSVALPSSLKELGIFCFDASGIKEITIPAGVKEIGEYAFAECPSLKRFTLESADTKVYDNVFNKTPNVEVIAPKNSSIIKTAEENGLNYTVK